MCTSADLPGPLARDAPFAHCDNVIWREARATALDVAEKLGGKRLLQREVRTELDLAELVRDGLPAGVLDRIVAESSRALAALEYLVHVDPANVPSDLVLLTIDVPDTAPRDAVALATLPARWAAESEPPECQALGDAWLRAGATLALELPAAPVPEERNVILDPRHPAHAGVHIVSSRPFVYDPRLLA